MAAFLRPTMTKLITDELDLLAELVPSPGPRVIELGCGAARMAQQMLKRWPGLRYMGLETMDTQAACRTYNILAGEGRNVVAALLLETP